MNDKAYQRVVESVLGGGPSDDVDDLIREQRLHIAALERLTTSQREIIKAMHGIVVAHERSIATLMRMAGVDVSSSAPQPARSSAGSLAAARARLAQVLAEPSRGGCYVDPAE